jgi:hypothetical protein
MGLVADFVLYMLWRDWPVVTRRGATCSRHPGMEIT